MRNLLAIVQLLALAACARPARRPAAPELAPPLAGAVAVWQSGTASWYGGDFHGRTTANGETYDMRKLTAAHQELPFHSLVEVENLENGRRVLVRINDRGPFLKDRIIDLSLKAAQRLGMVEKGTARVCLRVLRFGNRENASRPVWDRENASRPVAAPDRPPPPRAQAQAAGRADGGTVQAGAFAARENAEEQLRFLEERLPGLGFRIVLEDGLFKLLSRSLDGAECERALGRLAEYGQQGFVRGDPAEADRRDP